MRLNGELMSRNKRIADIINGEIQNADETLLPLYLKRSADLESWLAGRAIDTHRTNSRLLKKALRLGNIDDAQLVLKVNAATITDTYWVREQGSDLTYDLVRFKTNMFDKLALSGDPDSFNQPYSPTPELTNTGSFEKCWRLENNIWWMYKQGNDLERFSEMFVCELANALGFPIAEYQLDNGYIKSRDFTNGASINFESADGIVGEDDDYLKNFEAFWNISPEIAKQYIALIYTDTLCFNMDRHTKNYGVLREVETGKVLSLAPNFDNNIALIARGYQKNSTRENDRLIELFIQLLEKQPNALTAFKELVYTEITGGLLKNCCDKINISVDKDFICEFILNGENQIRQKAHEIQSTQGMQFEL